MAESAEPGPVGAKAAAKKAPAKKQAAKVAQAKVATQSNSSLSDLFPGANPSAAGLVRVLTDAEDFVEFDENNVRQITITSLIQTALFVGANNSANSLNSSAWLWRFVVDQLGGDGGEDGFSEGISLSYLSDMRGRSMMRSLQVDTTLGLAPVVANELLPRALDLAKSTVNRDVFDLRHLIAALLERMPTEWSEAGFPLTAAGLRSVREALVERIGQTPEKNEDMKKWRTDFLEASFNEYLEAQRDQPEIADALGRRPFAEVLANRIHEVRQSQDVAKGTEGVDRAFMVNLDGPWGSGKSTVVNFIEASLRARKERWVTVDFSAWRSQRIKPAWWGVVCQLARQTPSQLPLHRRMLFQMHWGWWKIRNDFAAYALVALLFGLAGLFGLVVPNLRPEAVAGQLWLAWLVEQSTTTQGWFKDPATVIATMTSILGAAGLARGIFFGSDSTAKAVEALSSDPYRHVMRLFERLVRSAGRPILIVIDDIDRCSEDYVVDLLEDIQTMLREAPVSYLVVGDRSWITSSFAKRYGEFKEQLEEPGRPIGYQFIEKVFQFSARVPALSDDVVRQFWSGLINKKLDKEGFNKRLRQFNDTANASIANARSETEMQNAIENASDPVLKRAIAARAAVRVASQDFSKELESRFTRYAHLLDRNPRSIKRLINRLGINQAVMLLSQRRINPGALARWTIIEMRWPQVAEALIAKPDLLDLTQGEERNGCIVAEMLKEPEFLRVVSANAALDSDDEADDVLTAQRLSEIVGGPQLAQVS